MVYDSPRHHPIAARFHCVTTEVLAEFEAEVREFFVRNHGIGKDVMERCGLQVWRNRAWAIDASFEGGWWQAEHAEDVSHC